MKAISHTLKKSGIYCIVNIKNNKKYIGSSKNIKQRLMSHRANLRHNNHENQHLQNAWNHYGEKLFDYYILEYCSEEVLLIREQWYINTLNPEYNINLITQRPPCSKESRQKQSNTRKRLIAEGKISTKTYLKTTYVYDLDGNFLKEYPSMKDAAIAEFGKNTGAVRLACLGYQNKYHRVHNRLFYLQKYDKVEAWNNINIQKPNLRKLYIVESDKEYYEFMGMKAIADFFKTTVASIRQYIYKKMKYKGIYMIYKHTAVS